MSKNLRTLDTDVYYNNGKISIQGNTDKICLLLKIETSSEE